MSEQLVDVVASALWLVAFGWSLLLQPALSDVAPTGRDFVAGVISTVFWSTLVGLALCEFTSTHAWLAGVVGL